MTLEILTPVRTTLSTEVDEVTVPGLAGEFGVLPGHAPLLAAIKEGTLSWRGKSGSGALRIGLGYCEVNGKDRITILTQSTAELSEAT